MPTVPVTSRPAGTPTLLFDLTLSGSQATLDTGANGVAGGFNHLLIVVLARADQVSVASALAYTFNGDGGANYDAQQVQGANAATGSSATSAGTAIDIPTAAAASTAAGVFGAHVMIVPAYVQTTAQKALADYGGFADTAVANDRIRSVAGNWRSTAAITRVTVGWATGGVNFVAGSRLTVYGF